MAILSLDEFIKKSGGTSKDINIIPANLHSAIEDAHSMAFGGQTTPETEDLKQKEAFYVGLTKLAREIPPNVGFLLGEAFGGPPLAGVGSAAGELLSQAAENIGGERKGFDIPKIAETGVTGAIIPPALKATAEIGTPIIEGLLNSAGRFIKPLYEIAKTGIQGIKKVLPGISDETSKTISLYPNEVEKLATQKSVPINYLVKDVQEARNAFETKLGTDYQTGWKKLLDQGEKYTFDNSKTINSVNDFLDEEAKNGKLYFTRIPNGKLDFSNSPFTEKQGEIVQKIVDKVENANPKNIAEVRVLKQQINNIYKEHAAQLGKTPELDRLVTNVIKAVDEGLPPGLKEISQQYSQGLKFLNNIDELLLPTSIATGQAKASTISKFKTLGKEEIKNLYPDFFKEFKAKTGIDLEKQLDIYNAAKEINPNLIPQDTSGIIKGLQRAANPIIGRVKIEAAKGTLPFQQTLKSIVGALPEMTKAWQIAKQAGKIGTEVSLFDFIRSQIGNLTNQSQ